MRRALALLPALAWATACGGAPQRVEQPIPGMMPPPVRVVLEPDTVEMADTTWIMESDTMAMAADTLAIAEPMVETEMADTLSIEELREVAALGPMEPMAPLPELAPTPEEPPPDLGPGTIGPGFTEAQVRAVLGDPLYRSQYGEHSFYFYDNGREKEAGFLDFVIFRSGRVVDAVFRHPRHHYAGNSSSPSGVTARPTPSGERLGVPPPPPPPR